MYECCMCEEPLTLEDLNYLINDDGISESVYCDDCYETVLAMREAGAPEVLVTAYGVVGGDGND